jgi:hypothetical protein
MMAPDAAAKWELDDYPLMGTYLGKKYMRLLDYLRTDTVSKVAADARALIGELAALHAKFATFEVEMRQAGPPIFRGNVAHDWVAGRIHAILEAKK